MNDVLLTPLRLNELEILIQNSLRKVLAEEETHNHHAPEREEYLTFSETCKAFDCSSVSLHKWKREGKIKFYRMGGKIYFKRSEVYGLQAAKISK